MSMAIKYAMNKKKMAKGGTVEACQHGSTDCKMCHGGMYAEGGEVKPEDEDEKTMRDDDESEEQRTEDIVERILEEKFGKDDDFEMKDEMPIADFEPNEFDVVAKKDDVPDFHYTEENSGDDLGDDSTEEEVRDIVDRIMRERKTKQSSGSSERE